MNKFCVSLLIVVFFSGSFSIIYSQVNEKDYMKMKYTKNLVFVPGNDKVEPFFISNKPITNREYIFFLQWLNTVYAYWPEKIFDAWPGIYSIPDEAVLDNILVELPGYSEPFVQEYMFNPDYLDYPVVGITWDQANEFLFWLTDRYNEHSLIESDILLLDPAGQMGEECFVTESYLADQYIGLVGEGIVDEKGGEFRNAKWEDGLVVPSFRLPTRAEFDLVKAESDLSGDIYVSGPYAYQIWKKDFILPLWNVYFGVSERGIEIKTYMWDEEDPVIEIPYTINELKWPQTILEWCLDSKLPDNSMSVREIYQVYGLQVRYYGEIQDFVEGDDPKMMKNEYGMMPYRIFRADDQGPEIVAIRESLSLPDAENYLYDPATNSVVSDHYDRIFTCFRYVVPAVKK